MAPRTLFHFARVFGAGDRRSLYARPAGGVLPKFLEALSQLKFMSENESGPLIVEGQDGGTARNVRESQSEYSEVCLPNDANLLGNMLGGHVMHLVDLCGAIAAMRHARCTVVTASIDQMSFLHPIHLGELVRLKSQVNRVFRTSMEVGVKVWVENLYTAELRHTSSAYLTFVALDRAGNRVVLAPIIPETEDERRRFAEAAERRAYRLAFKDKTKNDPHPLA
jgi:acyl-CoA hydrolase